MWLATCFALATELVKPLPGLPLGLLCRRRTKPTSPARAAARSLPCRRSAGWPHSPRSRGASSSSCSCSSKVVRHCKVGAGWQVGRRAAGEELSLWRPCLDATEDLHSEPAAFSRLLRRSTCSTTSRPLCCLGRRRAGRPLQPAAPGPSPAWQAARVSSRPHTSLAHIHTCTHVFCWFRASRLSSCKPSPLPLQGRAPAAGPA